MDVTFSFAEEGIEDSDFSVMTPEKLAEKIGLDPALLMKLKKGNTVFSIEGGGLKKNRILAGMSLEDLSEKSGIDLCRIKEFEENQDKLNDAKLSTLLKLRHAMNLSLSAIITDRETLDLLKEFSEEDQADL